MIFPEFFVVVWASYISDTQSDSKLLRVTYYYILYMWNLTLQVTISNAVIVKVLIQNCKEVPVLLYLSQKIKK